MTQSIPQPTPKTSPPQKPKKEWYSSCWGMIIAFIFLPYFLIWYIWAKTTWKNTSKAVVTAIIVLCVLPVVVGVFSSTPTPQSTQQKEQAKKETTDKKQVTQEEKKYTFDIPSLFNKSIDEIRSELGQPEDKLLEPNQQQLDLGTKEWSNTFKKANKELSVTYDVKTRKVIDFFIAANNVDSSGATKDKKGLLEMGNVKEDNPSYKVTFVKAIADPSSFTGVTITPNSLEKETPKPTETPKITPESTPTPETKNEKENVTAKDPQSREENIQKVVEQAIGAKTNMDKPTVRSIKILADGSVQLDINGSENLTNSMTKRGINRDVLKSYKAIFTTDDTPNLSVAIDVYFPGTDKYGNTSDSIAIRTQLTRETANKIQWDNVLSENIPRIFDYYLEVMNFN